MEFKSWDEYTELEQAQSEYSDYFKSVHGFRPRSITAGWDVERYGREMESLGKEAELVFAAEAERENSAVEDFKSLISSTIEIGAGDEMTAIRWMVQDEKFYSSQDVEQWVWDKGILFTDFGRDLVKQITHVYTFQDCEVA